MPRVDQSRFVGNPYLGITSELLVTVDTGSDCSDRRLHCEDRAEPRLALRNAVIGLRCLCQRIRLDNRSNFSLRYEIKCFVQILRAVLLASDDPNAFADQI